MTINDNGGTPVTVYVGFCHNDTYPVVAVHASVEKREQSWWLECIETTKAGEGHTTWNVPFYDEDLRIELARGLENYYHDAPLLFHPWDYDSETLLAEWRPKHHEIYLKHREVENEKLEKLLATFPPESSDF